MNVITVAITWGVLATDGVDFTGYYSYQRLRTASHDYTDLLLGISGLERSVDHLTGSFSKTDAVVTLMDRNGEISTALTTYQGNPEGKTVVIKIGDPDYGEASFTTLFTGSISSWTMSELQCEITAHNILTGEVQTQSNVWSVFANPLSTYGYGNSAGKTFTAALFPNLPTELDGSPCRYLNQLVPIIVGDMSSGIGIPGISPAFLIDPAIGSAKYRYVVAQHVCMSVDAVYRYEVLEQPTDYWTAYTVTTATYGGVLMTVIDFDFDQRDPDRAQLQEIAVVARGMTSGNTRYDLEVMADSPSAYWRLNDASAATTAADNTANAQTGTYVGAPTKQQTGPLLGDPNKAVLLNGSTQYITVPDNALLDPGDVFTLECWVKPNTSAGTTHTIFSKGANGYLVTLQNTLGTILVMLSKESVGLIAQNLSSLTNGVWTHIAVTKNGSAIHIYINGADSTTVILNRTIAGTASALNMGRTISTTADFFNGTIDEMAIYPTALSAARILVHYNNGTEPIFLENPVTVLYQFMTQFFGFAAASLKVNLWVSEALKAEANTVSAVSTPLRAGFVLTEATMTQQDLLLEFQVSFLLSVYSTRSNLYAPYIYTSASSTQSADFQVTDKYDILRDSLMVPSNQQFMSAIQINRLFSPLKNAYLVSPLAPTDLRGTLGTAVVKDYIPLVLNERLIGDDLAGVSTSMTYRYSELMGPAVQFPSVKFPLSCVNRDLIYALQVLRDIPSVLYRMNDVTSTMLDSSGNNYSGSFLFCTNGQTGPLLEDSNTSTLFNGSTSNALVLDSSLIDLGDVCTCEVWVYPTDLSTSPYIIDKGANAYGVQIGSSGIISFVKSGAAVLAFSTVAVQINQWSHICCTKNGTDVHVYLNGVDVSDVTSTSTLADNAVNLELGMSVGGTSHFAGNMANVALYNTAIGADRVYQHYASGVLVFGSNMYDLIDVNTVLGVTHWRARKFNHTGSPTYSVVYSGQTVRVLRISMDLSPENPTMQVTGITNMLSNGA